MVMRMTNTFLNAMNTTVQNIISVLTLDEEGMKKLASDPTNYQRAWGLLFVNAFIFALTITIKDATNISLPQVALSLVTTYILILVGSLLIAGYFSIILLLILSYFEIYGELRTTFTALMFVSIITTIEFVLETIVRFTVPAASTFVELFLPFISYLWMIVALGFLITVAYKLDDKMKGVLIVFGASVLGALVMAAAILVIVLLFGPIFG